jgi:hypothetical protein
MMQTAVLAIQVYFDCALPLMFCDLIHPSCRAGNAGTINQNIKSTEFLLLNFEKLCDLRLISHIGVSRLAGWEALLKCGQRSVVDIADVNFGARFRECGCNGSSNTGGACSYQNPQSWRGIESILERHS